MAFGGGGIGVGVALGSDDQNLRGSEAYTPLASFWTVLLLKILWPSRTCLNFIFLIQNQKFMDLQNPS